jgi:predicted RNA-binding protein
VLEERGMAEEPTHYIVVTSPENWAKTRELGWTMLGLKSTKPGMAAAFKPGDTVVAYATGIKKFIGAVRVTSGMFVDHTPIWGSAKKPGEDYSNRLRTEPLVMLDEDEYLDAFVLARRLEYAKKWGDHISLAFQGNIRPIPAADYELILSEMRQAQAKQPA